MAQATPSPNGSTDRNIAPSLPHLCVSVGHRLSKVHRETPAYLMPGVAPASAEKSVKYSNPITTTATGAPVSIIFNAGNWSMLAANTSAAASEAPPGYRKRQTQAAARCAGY